MLILANDSMRTTHSSGGSDMTGDSGNVCLVTGGNSGIGLETGRRHGQVLQQAARETYRPDLLRCRAARAVIRTQPGMERSEISHGGIPMNSTYPGSVERALKACYEVNDLVNKEELSSGLLVGLSGQFFYFSTITSGTPYNYLSAVY